VFLGLTIIAAGLWGVLSGPGTYRYLGFFFVAVGAFNMAVGIAALRERDSGSPSSISEPERRSNFLPPAWSGPPLQRWLAGQSRYPRVLIVIGPIVIVAAIGTLATGNWLGAFGIFLGVFFTAVGIAGLLERRSDTG
jgi:hypothetical protein